MHCKKAFMRNFICYCHNDFKRFYAKAKPVKKKRYSHTIKLPNTEFPHWMGATKRIELDEYILKHCRFDQLYSWQRQNLNGPEFILHDGPPYANGIPHMGHAINKILKDIINRSQIMKGNRVDYQPGWDCHGLPIEIKALRGNSELDPLNIREKAREFAHTAIRDQKAQFQSWGLMADWNTSCYYTFDPEYVQNQIKQFYNLYKKNLVYRDMKPVYWSPSSRTALAEAELEYKPHHISEAVTLRLRLIDSSSLYDVSPLYLLIWTTTPWSLPANEAVAFNPAFDYSVTKLNGSHYIICSNLVENLQRKLRTDIEVIFSFKGDKLSGLKYLHPLTGEEKPVLPADYVTDDVGTGIVHTAPSHGPDDYLLALKHKLPIVSYVNELGHYSSEAGNKLLDLPAMGEGMNEVLKIISNDVIFREKVEHSYPYDWRTKRPVMIRASKQWFIDTNTLKEYAIEALKGVNITPARNAAVLLSQIESRPYWCISRQRAWGVPIPVLYDQNDNAVITEDLIEHYCKLIDKEGTDFWWSHSSSELLPADFDSKYRSLEKGMDILDIWLDSGLSWSAVLNDSIADLYLEGIDQFTGWFQSSLLTSVALTGRAPYKSILSHGFAVDGNGRKMSKSLGNVINPRHITHGRQAEALGIDVLRWWVAGHSLQHTNIPVSKETIEDSLGSVKKIRNSLKFILGAIHDFPQGAKPKLLLIDQYILIKMNELLQKVAGMYQNYEFNKICKALLNFSVNDLSSLYCSVIKDRLYCDDGDKRIATQFTMNEIMYGFLQAFGPILPVLAEEVYLHHPHTKGQPFFFGNWRETYIPENSDFVTSVILTALKVKEEMMKEKPANAESSKLSCTITVGEKYWNHLNVLQSAETSTDSELVEVLQLSEATLIKSADENELEIVWSASRHHLCERCWKCTAPTPESLCQRCSDIVNN